MQRVLIDPASKKKVTCEQCKKVLTSVHWFCNTGWKEKDEDDSPNIAPYCKYSFCDSCMYKETIKSQLQAIYAGKINKKHIKKTDRDSEECHPIEFWPEFEGEDSILKDFIINNEKTGLCNIYYRDLEPDEAFIFLILKSWDQQERNESNHWHNHKQ